jgi:hypothetical protein
MFILELVYIIYICIIFILVLIILEGLKSNILSISIQTNIIGTRIKLQGLKSKRYKDKNIFKPLDL